MAFLPSFCGTCGNAFNHGDTFCQKCGNPRDPNTSEFTLPGISAIPRDVAQGLSGGMPTVCMNCGNLRKPEELKCPMCDTQAPTMPAYTAQLIPKLPTQFVTPPLIIQNPTPEQVMAARDAQLCPYGLGHWGLQAPIDLIKKRWTIRASRYYIYKPEGIYIQTTGRKFNPETVEVFALGAGELTNFAFQAELKILNRTTSMVGLIIRRKLFYGFEKWYSMQLSFTEDQCVVDLVQVDREYLHPIHLQAFECPTSYTLNNRTNNLLAVVAQDSCLDLYINLIYIGRVVDFALSTGYVGFVGFSNARVCSFLVSSAKIWVKEQS